MEYLNELPNSLIGWIGLLLAAVVGGFSAYFIYNRNKDGADDRLIKILKETVDAMGTTVEKQTKDIEELTRKVDAVTTENKTLRELITGRDEATQQFYKQAFESMKLNQDTHEMVKDFSSSFATMNGNMTKLIELLGKHVDVIDHAASNVTGGKA